MIRKSILCVAVSILFLGCNNTATELTEEEKVIADSLSKVRQKVKSDSLKKLNPLLILPPDSEYTGDYIDKYPNGIIKYKGFYRFGQRHGQWIAFYDNGLPWSEQTYDKGIRDGANIVYFENSKVRYKGFYKNDKRDSTWTFYDSLGTLIKTMVYKDDKEL